MDGRGNGYYELKPIGPRTGETQTPEYTQMTRKQKVPFMQSDEVSLSESLRFAAICKRNLRPVPCMCLRHHHARQGRRVVPYVYGELINKPLRDAAAL